jgi:hypothetical protein
VKMLLWNSRLLNYSPHLAGKPMMDDEMINFQKILKSEMNIAFETVNRDKFISVIESIKQGRS